MNLASMAFACLVFVSPALLFAQRAESTLPEITVSPEFDRQKSSWLLAPGSFSVTTENDIEQQQARSLSDLLRTEPGVEFTGGPRSQAELPQIRGFDSSRVLLLEDGARQNFQSGHNGRASVDANFLEAVEIVKGPWSSLYGSGALGGVISWQRPTAASYLRRTGRDLGAEVSLEGATAAEGAGARVTAFARAGRIEPLVSVRQRSSGNIRLGGGDRLPDSALEEKDLYAALGVDLGESQRVTLKAGDRTTDGTSPLNPNEAGSGAQTDRAETTQRKRDLILDYELSTSALVDLKARLYTRKTELEKIRLSDQREDLQSLETTGVDVWNHSAIALSENWNSIVTVGVEHFEDVQRGSRDGADLGAFPNAQGSQTGVSFQPQLIFDEKTKIAPGLRYDRYSARAEDESLAASDGEKWSGKLYLVQEYRPGQSVFLGYGEGFNAPRLADLYADGIHIPLPGPFPPPNFFVPNPELRPETSQSVELGSKNEFDWDGNRLRVDGTLYATEARDFIIRDVDLPGGTTTLRNLESKAQLYGFEFKTGLQRSTDAWTIGYSQTRGENTSTGESLPDLPAPTWILQAQFFDDVQPTWVWGTDLRYGERQSAVPEDVVAAAPYFVQDLFLQYRPQRSEGLSATFRVNNLYDREYQRNGSLLREVGRDFRLNLSWLF